MTEIVYTPTATAAKFHASDARVRMLLGAVGTGKTAACIMELQRRAFEQAPDAAGVRRTRWAIIRNQYPMLRSTTIKTFEAWIPPSIAPVVYDSPIRANLKQVLDDGTTVDAEFIFLALDRPEDVGKLLSLELTGSFINEASEIHFDIFKAVRSRIPRYPAKRDAELTWYGVILDTNPPSTKHWVCDIFERQRPKGFEIYKFAPPLIVTKRNQLKPDDFMEWEYEANPDASDYAQHQPAGFDYWLEQLNGAKTDINFVRRFLLGEYAESYEGKPVFPEFRVGSHVSNGPLTPVRNAPLIIGMDFGLFPAATFGQLVGGTLHIYDELAPRDVSLLEFLDNYLVPKLRSDFPGYKVTVCGDPSGVGRSGIDKRTPFMVLKEYGIAANPAYTNSFQPRRDAVSFFLRRMEGMIVDPKCEVLIDAMNGAYHYKEAPGKAGDREPMPDKDDASHIADSLQYLCLFFRYGKQGSVDPDDAFVSLRNQRMLSESSHAIQRGFFFS